MEYTMYKKISKYFTYIFCICRYGRGCMMNKTEIELMLGSYGNNWLFF